MKILARIESQLQNRWIAATSAGLIGAICVPALWWRARSLYIEYVYYPRVKAQDGYIYPQTRYLVFDSAELLWCVVGLATCALLFRYLFTGSMHKWTGRMLTAFAGLFLALVFGVFLGMMLRGAGI